MENHENSPNNRHIKGIGNNNQIKTIFEYLQEHIATASMISNETGIPQKNICRYKL